MVFFGINLAQAFTKKKTSHIGKNISVNLLTGYKGSPLTFTCYIRAFTRPKKLPYMELKITDFLSVITHFITQIPKTV